MGGVEKMIDEKKLISHIEKQYRLWGEKYDAMQILGDIEDFPKVDGWIPVEEGLPEPSLNSVIGWDAYRERCVFVQYYMNDWILGNHESVKIIAWMPLPEPYVKGEDEQ